MTATACPPPDPTGELIRDARRGDLDAWNQLHLRYRRQLAILMRGRIPVQTRSRFDTEDLVQSAFLSAFEELDSYEDRGEGSFRAWMTTILKNRLRDRIERAEADQRDPAREEDEDPAFLFGDGATPSEQLSSAETQTRLIEAMADLPDDLRSMLMLHRFDGLTFTQIGEQLGLSSSTVSRRVAEALELLERRLREG